MFTLNVHVDILIYSYIFILSADVFINVHCSSEEKTKFSRLVHLSDCKSCYCSGGVLSSVVIRDNNDSVCNNCLAKCESLHCVTLGASSSLKRNGTSCLKKTDVWEMSNWQFSLHFSTPHLSRVCVLSNLDGDECRVSTTCNLPLVSTVHGSETTTSLRIRH